MKKLRGLVAAEKPPVIICVGDRVSRSLHEHGITPQVAITDNKSLRRQVKPMVFEARRIIHVVNPQATITNEAENAVRDSLKGSEHVHILVEGEEDLLTPVAVLYAPLDSFVVYGQPHEGVVVVRVTAEKRARAEELLSLMAVRKLNKKVHR